MASKNVTIFCKKQFVGDVNAILKLLDPKAKEAPLSQPLYDSIDEETVKYYWCNWAMTEDQINKLNQLLDSHIKANKVTLVFPTHIKESHEYKRNTLNLRAEGDINRNKPILVAAAFNTRKMLYKAYMAVLHMLGAA